MAIIRWAQDYLIADGRAQPSDGCLLPDLSPVLSPYVQYKAKTFLEHKPGLFYMPNAL